MKSFYPKGKGRIHPSPGLPSAAPGGAVVAVLRLLPAAILALTAVLGDEDKEVLAYLITRSINGPAAAVVGEDRGRRRGGGAHRPMFDCGCFECYTSFWSRWDCSPDREIISQAIDAFEEQLESSEHGGGGGGGGGARSRRRERRAAEKAKGKNSKKGKEKEKNKAEENEENFITEEGKAGSVSENCPAAEEKVADEVEAVREGEDKEEEVTGSGMELVAVEQPERRRGWPDLMGLLNLRWWSLWNPGV